jgi:predicted O-linked N-acetylglucosamine transferase (SPINDLY family)
VVYVPMKLISLYDLAKDVRISNLKITGCNINTVLLIDCIKSVSLNGKSLCDLNADILDLSNVELHFEEVDKLIKAELYCEAELLLLGIAIISSSPGQAVLKLAELYESHNKYSKTIQCSLDLISLGINDPEVIYQLSFALFKVGRSDEALETILPLYSCDHSNRITRLCAFILKDLGQFSDAIDLLTTLSESTPVDVFSIRALSEIYANIGMYQKSLDTLSIIPVNLLEECDKLGMTVLHRSMGELDLAISGNQEILSHNPTSVSGMWTQCFNYSIASVEFADNLLELSQRFWEQSRLQHQELVSTNKRGSSQLDKRIRIGFLSSDIGDHVVSRFITPILRHYDKSKFYVSLFSTARRFEQKASEIVAYVDDAVSLQHLSIGEACRCIHSMELDIIIETNGFTRNSGLGMLANRCAPVQCHYIGYHATTGLDTIDYFFGDLFTTPLDFQGQYTEKIVHISSLWMAYDARIEFPSAVSTSKRDSLVMGAYSQVTKINQSTLEYWASAMLAVPDSILVIKDRGTLCPTTCVRIEDTLQKLGVDTGRVYLFGPVGSHHEHLDSYNAIDIALDTTPWSGATTAFEALGMGVPLVAICGDTTSGRMSTSVVNAAGMPHLIAHSKEEFASIVAELANNYMQIRGNKASMQQKIRSGILFDEERICRDFCATIDCLVQENRASQ